MQNTVLITVSEFLQRKKNKNSKEYKPEINKGEYQHWVRPGVIHGDQQDDRKNSPDESVT